MPKVLGAAGPEAPAGSCINPDYCKLNFAVTSRRQRQSMFLRLIPTTARFNQHESLFTQGLYPTIIRVMRKSGFSVGCGLLNSIQKGRFYERGSDSGWVSGRRVHASTDSEVAACRDSYKGEAVGLAARGPEGRLRSKSGFGRRCAITLMQAFTGG
jgi:hypothetical protein